MEEILAQISVFICFMLMAYLFTKEKLDTTGFVLLLGIISAIITSLVFGASFEDLFSFIPMKTLIFLIFMDIFIRILINEHVFEYFAIKLIQYTKSNMRLFFYLLSLTSALISGVMEDVSVALIVNPIIFRATKILKLDPKPFLYGVTASIILGNLLTPIASPVNIIFATAFEGIDFLDFQWFITYLSGLFVISMVIVLLFIDVKYLRKIGKPDPQNLRILLEIMDPNLLIRNKGRFYRYILYLLIILIGISVNFYPYIFIAVSVTLITLFEEHGFTKSLKKVNWGLPFLYIGLFLLIGSFQINGSADAVGDGLKTIIKDYLLVAILIVFFISGLISSFVSKSLSLLMFAAILDSLFFEVFIETNQQMILVLTLFVTLHLIGNFVPQSSSFILKTIEQAENRKIDKFNYTSMARSLRYFTLIEAVIGLLYIFALALLLKVF